VWAKIVCPAEDCQAARWHADYAPPIQHGEWRRQTRYYSHLHFILCIAADIWKSWNKHTFQMSSLLLYIIGLTVHLLRHGSIIAIPITLNKFYHTAQSEFNFLLIWELVCAQSVLEHSPPHYLTRAWWCAAWSELLHTAGGDKNEHRAMEWWLAGENWTNLKNRPPPPPPPAERNTAWNMGRKFFHCLGAPNNLIRPCITLPTISLRHNGDSKP